MAKYKKAKDFPIGTKFVSESNYNGKSTFTPVTLIAHSKQGDEVGVFEDDDGDVFCENVNDLYPENYVQPIDAFIKHILNAINNATLPQFKLTAHNVDTSIYVENMADKSIYKLEVECTRQPKEK